MEWQPVFGNLGQPATLRDMAHAADERGLLNSSLKELPPRASETLRAVVAGERPAHPLAPDDIAQVGQVAARWGAPVGRYTIHFGAPPLTTEALTERLHLSPAQAARVLAITGWPVGFTPEDLSQWGQLSPEQTDALWTLLETEYGFYGAGTLYAVP